MADQIVAEDTFDKLRIAPDLTRALRAANLCARNALVLIHQIQTCDELLTTPRSKSEITIAQMCSDGAKCVLEVIRSCQALEAALEPLGTSCINVIAQGPKRIGDINGTSYHETVLNWSAYLCVDIASLRWTAGRAPLVSESMRPLISINWKSNVSRVARNPNTEKAIADIDRVLPMLVDEAVEVHRRREASESIVTNRTKSKSRPRGRPKPSKVSQLRDLDIAERWKDAFERKGLKADFAKDNQLEEDELNLILDRVRRRKSRANESKSRTDNFD